jgi:hypothetical protein
MDKVGMEIKDGSVRIAEKLLVNMIAGKWTRK